MNLSTLIAVLTCLTFGGVRAFAQDSRPNVLYIMTDQHTAEALSCAGNEYLSTPNIDRIAAKGMRFTRAYVTYPLCTPSRASMFTGKMPHELGIRGNNIGIAEEHRAQSLGQLLSAAGYDCGYGGKWHLQSLNIPDSTFGFQNISNFNDFRLAQRSVDFIRQERNRPFFLVASFDNPHNICEWARNQTLPWGPIGATPETKLPNLPANFLPPPFEPEVIRETQAASTGAYAAANYSPKEWRHYRGAYYRLVEKVDTEIGVILRALEESGQYDNTLIIFASDHGDGNAAHQWNQKSVLYEESVRVPFVVKPPRSTLENQVESSSLISVGLDLLPTICDYTSVDVPEGLAGQSTRPLVEGQTPIDWRKALFIETEFNNIGVVGRAVVTSQYKYMVYSRGQHREQLIDLLRDSGEMVNLAIEARYVKVLNEHRHQLYDWCQKTGDFFGSHYSQPKGTVSVPGHSYEKHDQ